MEPIETKEIIEAFLANVRPTDQVVISSTVGMAIAQMRDRCQQVVVAPVGQALSVALGLALSDSERSRRGDEGLAHAARLDQTPQRVFCFLGQGDVTNGQTWEAAAAAHHYHVNQLYGILITSEDERVVTQWKSFGWEAAQGKNGFTLKAWLGAARGEPRVFVVREGAR